LSVIDQIGRAGREKARIISPLVLYVHLRLL